MTNIELYPVPSDHPVADLPPAAFVALPQRSFQFFTKADAADFFRVMAALAQFLNTTSLSISFESGDLVGTSTGDLNVTVSDAEGRAAVIAAMLGRVHRDLNRGY